MVEEDVTFRSNESVTQGMNGQRRGRLAPMLRGVSTQRTRETHLGTPNLRSDRCFGREGKFGNEINQSVSGPFITDANSNMISGSLSHPDDEEMKLKN